MDWLVTVQRRIAVNRVLDYVQHVATCIGGQDCDCGLNDVLHALHLQAFQARQGDTHYWAAAIALVADELARIKPEELPERKDKMIAVLRIAAYYLAGSTAFNDDAFLTRLAALRWVCARCMCRNMPNQLQCWYCDGTEPWT
jgi:hypothetical protein